MGLALAIHDPMRFEIPKLQARLNQILVKFKLCLDIMKWLWQFDSSPRHARTRTQILQVQLERVFVMPLRSCTYRQKKLKEE